MMRRLMITSHYKFIGLVWRWKNFECRSTFGEIMGKSRPVETHFHSQCSVVRALIYSVYQNSRSVKFPVKPLFRKWRLFPDSSRSYYWGVIITFVSMVHPHRDVLNINISSHFGSPIDAAMRWKTDSGTTISLEQNVLWDNRRNGANFERHSSMSAFANRPNT